MTATLTILATILGSSCEAQVTKRCAPSSTQVRLSSKQYRSLLDAVVGIGRASGVCMGVELMDAALIDHAGATRESSGAAEAAVRSLLVGVPQYCVESRGKILSVKPCQGNRDTWLDFRLPHFEAHPEQLQTMSTVLNMWLSDAVKPAKGYMGHYRSGNPANAVGPYNEANVSVRELLDRFVGDSSGGAWITVRPYARRTANAEPTLFWLIAEYDDESLVRSVWEQARNGFVAAEK
ncbi:MAG: hypothetical protein ABSH09_16740 [Bryobacteraceae bacterium]